MSAHALAALADRRQPVSHSIDKSSFLTSPFYTSEWRPTLYIPCDLFCQTQAVADGQITSYFGGIHHSVLTIHRSLPHEAPKQAYKIVLL